MTNLKGIWRLKNGKRAKIIEWDGEHWKGHLIEDTVDTPLRFTEKGDFWKPGFEQWDLAERLSQRDNYPQYLKES